MSLPTSAMYLFITLLCAGTVLGRPFTLRFYVPVKWDNNIKHSLAIVQNLLTVNLCIDCNSSEDIEYFSGQCDSTKFTRVCAWAVALMKNKTQGLHESRIALQERQGELNRILGVIKRAKPGNSLPPFLTSSGTYLNFLLSNVTVYYLKEKKSKQSRLIQTNCIPVTEFSMCPADELGIVFDNIYNEFNSMGYGMPGPDMRFSTLLMGTDISNYMPMTASANGKFGFPGTPSGSYDQYSPGKGQFNMKFTEPNGVSKGFQGNIDQFNIMGASTLNGFTPAYASGSDQIVVGAKYPNGYATGYALTPDKLQPMGLPTAFRFGRGGRDQYNTLNSKFKNPLHNMF